MQRPQPTSKPELADGAHTCSLPIPSINLRKKKNHYLYKQKNHLYYRVVTFLSGERPWRSSSLTRAHRWQWLSHHRTNPTDYGTGTDSEEDPAAASRGDGVSHGIRRTASRSGSGPSARTALRPGVWTKKWCRVTPPPSHSEGKPAVGQERVLRTGRGRFGCHQRLRNRWPYF